MQPNGVWEWLRSTLTVPITAVCLMVNMPPAAHGQEPDKVILPYQSAGYRYKVVPFGAQAGFERPGFDDAAFAVGDAPFGTKSSFCALYAKVKTQWPLNTDLLLRKSFSLPVDAQAVKVAVAIDNDIQVFVNGVDISFGLEQTDGCAARDQVVFPVPSLLLKFGGENLLAVRAHDRGTLSFCDVEVRTGPTQVLHPKSIVYTLKSGNGDFGQPDPQVWVQGSAVPLFGAIDSRLPIQQAFVVKQSSAWATVEGARWVSPTRLGEAAPEGYEYFVLFALPPGFRTAQLDVLWLADDQAEVALNDARLPVPWASFSRSGPRGEYHGEVMSYLRLGMNRLQFFASNARVGVNPTGVSFLARLILSP
jgi:hypothetical protein